MLTLKILKKDIPYTMEFLNKFFGNLLLDENNVLDNCEMQIKDVNAKEIKSLQKILELIVQNPKITTTEMAETLGISRRAIAKQISTLKKLNKISRIGPDKGDHWEIVI